MGALSLLRPIYFLKRLSFHPSRRKVCNHPFDGKLQQRGEPICDLLAEGKTGDSLVERPCLCQRPLFTGNGREVVAFFERCEVGEVKRDRLIDDLQEPFRPVTANETIGIVPFGEGGDPYGESAVSQDLHPAQ